MDIVYHVNSYHRYGIGKLIRFLKNRPNITYREYATIASRFYNEVLNSSTISIEKIRLIQECLYTVNSLFPHKIYGFDDFVKFMAKKHERRVKVAENIIRNWIIKSTEDPKCTIGKRRKIDEYNNYRQANY